MLSPPFVRQLPILDAADAPVVRLMDDNPVGEPGVIFRMPLNLRQAEFLNGFNIFGIELGR